MDLLIPLGIMGGGMGLAMMPLGTHVMNSAPRDLVSRVTSLIGACQNVVASLAIASFATMLQARYVANAAAVSRSRPRPRRRPFGDVYGYAMLLVVAAALMALSLRRSSSPAGVSQPAWEVVSSAL